MFYAIAVGYLADRLTGGDALATAHHNEEPLRREEVMALQQGLRKLGYLTAEPDGVVGGSTRQGVRAFQRARKLPPDGYAGRDIYTRVLQQAG
jgi:peptidoglycan hydrolase-like protein with peptidoglycan-binding domain